MTEPESELRFINARNMPESSNSSWSVFLSCTQDSFGDQLHQYPFDLIQSTASGPEAASRENQQILQIAQSFLVMQCLTDRHSVLNQKQVQGWLCRVAQPTCGQLFRDFFPGSLPSSFRSRLKETVVELNDPKALRKKTSRNVAQNCDIVERILQLTDSTTRNRQGVFYTPPELAAFVLRRVDDALRRADEFSEGLFSSQKIRQPNILDPAVGAGVFLVEAIKLAKQRFDSGSWTRFAVDAVLRRLHGCDLMLPALVATHLNIAACLAESGFDFGSRFVAEHRLNLVLANCVGDLVEPSESQQDCESQQDQEQAPVHEILRQRSMHVVVGNPPFSALSEDAGNWIRDLIRGNPATDDLAARCGYLHVNGHSINERKIWLYDDYVKFFRYAQWQIDRCGTDDHGGTCEHRGTSKNRGGAIGLVTNRGYLDNITFRGMRHLLSESFPNIQIFDIGGDSRNRNETSAAAPDENLFPIETGIALSVMSKGNRTPVESNVFYGRLTGSASEKLSRLSVDDFAATQSFAPTEPNVLFVPRDRTRDATYDQSSSIDEVMLRSWSAPVTARDHFVVAFSREELEARIADFSDAAIDDETVRQRYFSRTRSSRYPKGDSRGWRVAEARKFVRECSDWKSLIRKCTYRPFDERWIFWTPQMIDWHRGELASELSRPGNIAIIARRQSPPGSEATFFHVADSLVLDGVLRSDNRGSEKVFPLWVTDPKSQQPTLNFPHAFLELIESCWHAGIDREVCCATRAHVGTGSESISGRDLMAYIYAVFHAGDYREYFREQICTGFPRIPICHSAELARQLMNAGSRLIEAHLMRDVRNHFQIECKNGDERGVSIESGFPEFANNAIAISKGVSVPNVDRQIWQLRIGTHQVARKWLVDRKGRTLKHEDLQSYLRLLSVAAQTVETMREIQQMIADQGGWESQFVV